MTYYPAGMSQVSAREMVAVLFANGMSERAIAEATGTTQPTINRIRTGVHAEPRFSTWTAITELYLAKQAESARRKRVHGQ